MPTRVIESPKVLKPIGGWNSALEIAKDSRCLITGGVAGVRLDGTFDADIEGQTAQMFQNLIAILEAADMTMDNVVRLSSYLIDIKEYERYSKAREPYIGHRKPAVTLLAINGLPRPGLRVEIEVIAAS